MRLTRPLCAALLLCALPAGAAQLEFFPAENSQDYRLFAGVWDYGVGGDIASAGNRITLDSDSGVKANPQAQVQLRYGFAGPWWLPRLGAGYVHLGAAGQYLAPQSLRFAGIDIISGNTLILAGINLNDYELSADLRLLDWHDGKRSFLRLEPGLAVKYLSGHATVMGTTTIGVIGLPLGTVVQKERFAVEQPVPLAHLRAELDPLPWLRVEFSGGYFALDGNHAGEMRVAAEVRVWNGVRLSAGYQEQLYKVNEAPFTLHARIDGPSLGLSITSL